MPARHRQSAGLVSTLAPVYRPRRPTETVLYRIVCAHLATFLAHANLERLDGDDPQRAKRTRLGGRDGIAIDGQHVLCIENEVLRFGDLLHEKRWRDARLRALGEEAKKR